MNQVCSLENGCLAICTATKRSEPPSPTHLDHSSASYFRSCSPRRHFFPRRRVLKMQIQSHQTPAPHSPLSFPQSPKLSIRCLPLPSQPRPPLSRKLHQPHMFSLSSSSPTGSSLWAFAAAPSTWSSPTPPNGCFVFNTQVSAPRHLLRDIFSDHVPTAITSITSPYFIFILALAAN